MLWARHWFTPIYHLFIEGLGLSWWPKELESEARQELEWFVFSIFSELLMIRCDSVTVWEVLSIVKYIPLNLLTK